MCATCAIMYDRTAKNKEVLCGTVFFIVSKDFFHCNAFLVPSGAKRARHGACQSRQPRQTASQWFFLPQTALSRLFPPFLSAFLHLPNVQCRLSCPTIFCTLLLCAYESSVKKNINFFKKPLDFLFCPCYDNEAVSQEAHGVLAQLGERHTGSVEVSGSIPLCSTTIRTLCQTAKSSDFLYIIHFCPKEKRAGILPDSVYFVIKNGGHSQIRGCPPFQCFAL